VSGHLTSQQISEWISGLRAAGVKEHLERCRKCSSELDRFESALTEFRGAVREWSAVQMTGRIASPSRSGAAWRSPQRLAWAAAAIFAAVVLSFSVPYFYTSHPMAANPNSDAALLIEVSSEVSRVVPGPMEPLMRLTPSDNAARNQ